VKQHRVRTLLGFAITLFFIGHAVRWYEIGLISQLDHIIYDQRLEMTMPRGIDESIVILDIDEKSLQEVARWPWPRDLMARLVDKLFDKYRIALLGFDVVFAEPDHSSGVRALDTLARGELKDVAAFQQAYRGLRPGLDNDGRFAAAIKDRPVVLGFSLNPENDARRIAALPPPVLPQDALKDRKAELVQFVGYGGNLERLQKNAAGAGHFYPWLDQDGMVRRVPLIVELDGASYEALSLAMLRVLIGQREGRTPPVVPVFPAEGATDARGGALEFLQIGRLQVPVDESANALVPYRGRQGSFRYVSLSDVLNDRVPLERLAGKVALVGTTAPGLRDQRATPVQKNYAGVEIHANLLAGMLEGKIKHKPLFMVGAEALLLLAGGAVLSLLIPMLAAGWATLAAGAGLVLITALDVAVWQYAGWVLPLATSLLMTSFIYTMNMAYGYFIEDRIKRRVAARFGQYVPPEVVDQIVADPDLADMEPKAAELTILFADIRGFTGISEALSPEQLHEYINQYLTDMSAIIRARYRGTLDKYIGDAIMAFWGAPVEDAQHARNGVLAALEMQRECRVLNEKLTSRGWPALAIGVGVNTGSVRVGDMGSQVRRAYTAMGDAVNVASRLEGRTKHYGVGILVGEATRNAVEDIVFREVDRIKVKGRDTAITVYEPVDNGRDDELRRWNQALRAYRAQQWNEAEAILSELQGIAPDCGLYPAFAAKVADLRRNPPPPGWDGVTAFDEK
jgi:adenylate cyclase